MPSLKTIYSAKGVPFTVAADHADRFKAFLDDPDWGDYALDAKQSGGYNPRTIAGTRTPSQHAFGRAVDLNWTRNARGTAGDIPPELARRLAERHGLRWGGDWSNPDPMHFEVMPSGATPVAQRGITAFAGMTPPSPAPSSTASPQPSPRPTPMPLTSYDGDTPEQVQINRRLATALLGQATGGGNVGSWAGVLARPLQAILGGQLFNRAGKSEREGRAHDNAALRDALLSSDPNAAIAQGLGGGYDPSALRGMAGQAIQSRMQEMSPQGQRRAALEQEQLNQLRQKPWLQEMIRKQIESGEQRAPAAPASPAAAASDVGTTSVPGITVAPPSPVSAPAPAARSSSGGVIDTPLGRMSAAQAKMIGAAAAAEGKGELAKMMMEAADPNKDMEKASQKERGEAIGKAKAILPKVMSDTNATIKQIDDLLYAPDPNNPGKYLPNPKDPKKLLDNPELSKGIGWWAGNAPDSLKSAEVHDVQEKISQVGGGAFLSAYESLRGSGSITENEARPATSALARLKNLRQSDPGFRAALRDFRNRVLELRQLAHDRAEGKLPMPSETPAPIPQAAQPADGFSIRKLD